MLPFKITTGKQTCKESNYPLPTQLIVTVKTEKKADYVMIEVPIPAGCSYGEKTSNTKSWWRHHNENREIHRESPKEKVNIFCESMPKGTYTYIINLEPRYSGAYTLNPAKAEEMYFPVFYGRNKGKKVKIEGY